MIAAFLAGYFSLVLTAVLTGVEFGIQPWIASSADGKALYCPYDLKIAVPAMAIQHLLLFGFVEGIVTALIVRYFVRHQKQLVYVFRKDKEDE
jgi:cobalt/nickel transport system permease protein